MASVEREPITGVCGKWSNVAKGAEPLVEDQGAKLKLKAFCAFSYKRGAKDTDFSDSSSRVRGLSQLRPAPTLGQWVAARSSHARIGLWTVQLFYVQQ